MEEKKYFVFDGVMYGFRATFANIRLMFFTWLTVAASFLAVTGFLASIYIGPFQEVIRMIQQQGRQGILFAIKDFTAELSTITVTVFSLGLLFFFFFFGWFTAGLVRISLDLYDKGQSSARRLFSVFGIVPKALVAGFLFILIFLVGCLFFVIPGIIWVIRAQFYIWFLVDKDCGILESFKKSFDLTHGHSWNLFGLLLIAHIIIWGGPGMGFITGLGPFILLLARVFIYRRLSGAKKGNG